MKLVQVFSILIVFVSIHIHPSNVFSADGKSIEVVAAVLRHWPPQYLTDEKTGEPSGFAIDVMNRISELSNLKVRYVVYEDWPEVVKAVQENKAVLLPNMGITAERKKLYNFTSPYETFRISAFVRDSTTDINDLSHLFEKKVGAVETNKGLELIKERGATKIEKFESPENLLLALLSGEVDAAIYPENVFLKLAINSGLEERIKIIGQPLQEIKRGIAIRKGEQKLLQQLNDAVDHFLKSPQYRSIYTKWYGKAKPFWDVKRVTITSIAIFGLAAAVMFFWRHVSITKINKALNKHVVELKTSKDQLNATILREHTAIRAANVGLWEWDLATNKIRFSREWKKQIGYENHEIGNDYEEWENRVHPDDLGPTIEIIKQSITSRRQDHQAEFRFRHKDGSYRWILTQGSVIQDDSGAPIKMIGSHLDITNRKQREENLRESEARYRHLFNTMTQGVVIQDAEGKIIEANQAACTILGLSMDQMFGKTAYDPRWKLIHDDGSPYDPSEMPSNIALRTGKPIQGVHCGVYVPEEDTYRWIIIGSAPRFEPEGKIVTSTMTVFSDITKLKSAESQISETEIKYRDLFEYMTAGFVLFEVVQDEAGTPVDLIIIAANQGFEGTTGLKVSEVVGKKLTEVLPGIEKDEADWIGTYGMVALTGESKQFEQGSELLGYYYSISAYQATPKQCGVTFVDITESKLAELRLQKSEYRFRRTVEHLPHVIVIYDKDLKIQYINAATLKVSGRPKSDFIGKTDEEIWPPEICNKWMPMLRNTLETGHTSSLETTLNLEEEMYLRITTIAIKDDLGKVLEVIGITEDMTENKRQEREIRDFTAYLQSEIEKERTAISREIHDDLGPTMTALKFDLSWLKRRLSKDQVPLLDKMGTMMQTIDSSMHTIKNVCTELRPGILDDMGIGPALEWYVTRFEDRTGISCQLVVDPKDMIVEKDMSTALFRIHQEALTNINRHAEATRVNIGLVQSSEQIELTIEDNGKGINDISRKTHPSFGIIGMRERVAEFGGEFSIENRKEGGARVAAKLPLISCDVSVEEV